MGAKIVGYAYMLFVLAVVEPLAIPVVLIGSAVFGGIGGWASAKRYGIISSTEITTHVVSMSILGASIAMLGYWWLGEDGRTGYLLVGAAGFCGLVGMPIFDPLSMLATKSIEAVTNFILKKIEALTNDRNPEK